MSQYKYGWKIDFLKVTGTTELLVYMLDCMVMHMRKVKVRRAIEELKVHYTTWTIAILAAKSIRIA